MSDSTYDLLVIGSGPGGYPAAIRAATLGKRVALIEAYELGGTCLNRGCIPSKALISSARAYHQVLHVKEHGVEVGSVKLNFPAMVERAESVVVSIRKSLEGLLKAHGVEILRGKARFAGAKELEVAGKSYRADKILIAAGSEPKLFPTFPVDGKQIHDSTSFLKLEKLPKSLIVIGGGVIGCEFASLMSLLGVEVTIVEALERLLVTESIQASKLLTRSLKKRGVKIHTRAKVEKVSGGSAVTVELAEGKTLQAESALISVGRTVLSNDLDLEKTGLTLSEKGTVSVNASLETEVAGIYAIGDFLGKYWLAHVATHQGVIAAENAFGAGKEWDDRAIPSVVFTDPEIASVGQSKEKLTEEGRRFETGTFPFAALGKAHAAGKAEGYAELYIESETKEILGAEVVGSEASALIAGMTLAIANELTAECIAETIYAHPTMPEAWHEATLCALNDPLHLPPKKKA